MLASALVVACGGGVSTPPPTTGDAPAPARATPETVEKPSAADGCGGFELLPLDSAPMPLLDHRLELKVPKGATSSGLPADVERSEGMVEMETRILLSDGDKQLAIISEELGALAPTSLADTLKVNSPRLTQANFREATLPSGLKVLFATHNELPTPGQAVPLAHAFTTLPDNTLQATRVFVSPSVTGTGCVDFALKLLSTLAPGKRTLDLSAGERKLSGRFGLTVAQNTLIVTQLGPDAEVHRVLVVRELGTPAPQMGIYVGIRPAYSPEANAKQVPGKVLGKPVTWLETNKAGVIERETLIQVDGLSLHLFMAATDQADIDALTTTASTLKDTLPPGTRPPPATK